MTTGKYILVGKEPVLVTSLEEWGKWFETADRRIALTKVGEAEVSTVFLGIDHSFDKEGPPVVFETMIFGGKHDQEECIRAATWDDAMENHKRTVKVLEDEAKETRVLNGLGLGDLVSSYRTSLRMIASAADTALREGKPRELEKRVIETVSGVKVWVHPGAGILLTIEHGDKSMSVHLDMEDVEDLIQALGGSL